MYNSRNSTQMLADFIVLLYRILYTQRIDSFTEKHNFFLEYHILQDCNYTVVISFQHCLRSYILVKQGCLKDQFWL